MAVGPPATEELKMMEEVMVREVDKAADPALSRGWHSYGGMCVCVAERGKSKG